MCGYWVVRVLTKGEDPFGLGSENDAIGA